MSTSPSNPRPVPVRALVGWWSPAPRERRRRGSTASSTPHDPSEPPAPDASGGAERRPLADDAGRARSSTVGSKLDLDLALLSRREQADALSLFDEELSRIPSLKGDLGLDRGGIRGVHQIVEEGAGCAASHPRGRIADVTGLEGQPGKVVGHTG